MGNSTQISNQKSLDCPPRVSSGLKAQHSGSDESVTCACRVVEGSFCSIIRFQSFFEPPTINGKVPPMGL